MSKQYGLIIPGKKSANATSTANFTKPSIFGSDSDSDEQAPKRLATVGPGASEKRQARRIQEKALEEDPTIFQYDELYDDIESKRAEEKNAKSQEGRKPKYIGRLLEYAERRKIENERRVERTVQKEREREGEEFKDKEAFVTGAYRRKLEELRKAEEREKREAYLEAIGDVTKQQDLGGFYRHLYEQKLNIKEEKEQSVNAAQSAETAEAKNEELIDESSANKIQMKPAVKSRAYRKRQSSDDDEGEATASMESAAKKIHLQSNLDADSDFSIDDTTDSEDDDNKTHAQPALSTEENNKDVKDKTVELKTEENSVETTENATKNGSEENQSIIKPEEIKKEKEEEEGSRPKSPKPNKKEIWKKRTVGEVFDAALARYYERKAARKAWDL